MHIIVCMKQVPGTAKVQIDPETGVLQRDGISAKTNPYDLFALETALQLKGLIDAKISVLCMGPPQARAVIKEAYMIGADQGFILSDAKFAGSDVLATSYILACGIRKIGEYDLIICGKQTTDGDTAQVGPAIAERLKIPHSAYVREIEDVDQKGVVVEQNMEEHVMSIRMNFPCLLAVEKDIYIPRLPSYLNLKKTEERPVTLLTMSDLPSGSEKKCGLTGSATRVERIFQPEPGADRIIWDMDENDCVDKLYDHLVAEKFI